MHIAVLTHNYPRFPGDFSGSFVAALSSELARQGSRVSVLAPWDPAYGQLGTDSPVAQRRGMNSGRSPLRVTPSSELVSQGPSSPLPALHLWRYAPRADWHRLGYMRTMEADVRMRGETYWLAPLFFAAGVAATLRWCRQHRPDVIHAHWLLPNGFFGAVASRALGIPLVVSIPGSDALVAGQNPLFRAMARFTLDQAGLVTANSHALRDVAIHELGADPTRFDLIIYGVDPRALRPDPSGTAEQRAQWGVPTGALLLLAVGRMVYKKGFDVLLRALAILKQHGLLSPPQHSNLPTHQSINPPIYQSTNPPTYQSTIPPTYQSTIPPTYQSTIPPTYQSTIPPTYQSTIPPTHQSTTHQSTNLPTHQSTNLPSHQPTNLPSHQPTNPVPPSPPSTSPLSATATCGRSGRVWRTTSAWTTTSTGWAAYPSTRWVAPTTQPTHWSCLR
jgi:hypothetical protein